MNTVTNCAARPFLFNLGYTISLAPFLVKAVRVYQLFIANPLQKNKTIGQFTLIGEVLFIAFMDLVIIFATLLSSNGTNPILDDTASSSGAVVTNDYCAYTKNKALLYTEIAFKATLLTVARLLAFRMRNIPSAIAGSKTALVIVYNTAVVSAVVILMIQLITGNIPLTISIQVVGICYVVTLNAW